MTGPLEGRKVLIVEDEFLVASLIQDMLESAGCIVTGPIARVPEALTAADREDYDLAVLDVNLAGARIEPVAEALSRRHVPFVFVTGYAIGALPHEYAERPRICKPFKMAELLGALSSLVSAARPTLTPPCSP
jgi:DNA-binding response OmpR family regulator